MRFRERHSGESKLDTTVMIAFAAMIGDKMIGRFLPLGYLALIAGVLLSVAFHVATLAVLRGGTELPFAAQQSLAGALCLTATLWIANRFRPGRQGSHAVLAGAWLAAAPGLITNVWLAVLLDRAGIAWIIAGTSGALVGALATYAARSALVRDK